MSALIAYLMLVGQVAPLALAATPAPARALAPAATSGGADSSRELKAAPAPAAPVFVPSITATKSDSFTDSDGDLKAEPGQEVSYEVLVTNNGTAATGVQFSDTIDANTTLVPGSLTASPLARDDAYNVEEDTQLVVPAGTGVLFNDFGVPPPSAVAIGSGSTVQGGTVSLAIDGSFTYDPPTGFDGTDSFTYTATNGNAPDNGATVTITVGPLDDAPTAVDDSATVAEDAAATTINVQANDTDPDGGTNTIQSVTQPANGSVSITNAGADLTYEPNDNYCNSQPGGTPDTFTYTLNGGDSATVSVTVTCSDDNATAVNDSATVSEDSGANTVNVLANDNDPDGGTTTVQSVTQPANGTAAVTNAGADVSYTPNANYCNNPPGTTPDTFTYTLNGGSSATVSVTVTCVDDNPTAVNDSATVPEDSGATPINVQANDTDPDGGTNTIQSVTQPTNGSVSITNAGADLTYTPNANYCGSDSFTYTLSPGGSIGTVNVTVTCSDDAPVAVNDAATVAEDSGANAIDVLGNDTDIDAGPKTVNAVTQGTNGAVAITGGGTGVSYTPNANYFGSDSFTYTLNGGSIGTVTVTVTEVNDAPSAVNDTLSDVLEDSGTRVIAFSALTGNDSAGPANENTQTFNITGLSNFTGGTAVVNGTNVEFTPTANYCGAAGFTYTATDNGTTAGSSDPKSSNANVSFNISCVNDAPSFTPGANVTVNEDSGAFSAAWATGISPGPGESQTVSFGVTNNNNGLFTGGGQPAIAANGTLTFTPAPNAFGVATVTVILSDNGGTANGGDDTADAVMFTITVTAINDPPTAGADAWDFIGNTVLEVDAADDFAPEPTVYVNSNTLTNDTDPVEGNPVAVTGVVGCADTTGPSFDNCATANGGSVDIGADGRFIYRPKAGDTAATDSFQYVLTDTPNPGEGSPASVNGTVTLTRKGRVWYVNNQAAAPGNGTSATPFNTLAAADTASVDGDTIYVFRGDGTTTGYNTGVSLSLNQRLIGQGVALSLPLSVNGTNPYPLLPAGSQPLITNSAGNAVSIGNATGVEIRGLTISSATANAIDLTSTGAANASVTIANNTISGAALEGIDINANSTGTTTADVQSNTIASAGNGFDAATGAAGTLNIVFSNNTGITSTAANGVVINGAFAGSTARITGFSGNQVSGNTVGGGVSITSAVFDATPGGAYDIVSAGDTDIGDSGNPVGGGGMALTTVRGDLSFADLDIFASSGVGLSASSNAAFNAAGAGLRIQVASGAGTLSANGGPALNATQVLLNLPTIAVSSSGSTTFGVNFDNTDGSTFSSTTGSTISSMSTASATAFRVNGSDGGTYTYNGTITTTGSKGVDLANNPGSTVSFTNDLVISSGTGGAFNANNSGTVSVTDSTAVVNTLTTTSGTALNFVNTTIGTGGINFKSISATNAPVNGIVLNNTGATAGLSVIGDGSNHSGGAITNATGDAISLTNTRNVVLDELNIQNPGGDGIDGRQVTNFTITDSTINDAGDGLEESAIAFNNNKTTDNNIAGTLTVTGNTLTNSYYSGLDVQAGNGTITQATVSNNTITTTTNGFGVNFVGSCTPANTCFNLDNADINQNNISGVRGHGIQVQVSSDTTGTAQPHAGLLNDATKRIDITNNSIDVLPAGGSVIAVVTGGPNSNAAARPKFNFLIECNGKNTGGCTAPTAAALGSSDLGTVILVGNNGYSDMTGVINNNAITATHTVGGGGGNGIGGGNGVSGAGAAFTPDLALTVTNNTISGTDGNGILLVGRSTNGFGKFKIANNNVGEPLDGNRSGIRVDAGNATAGSDDNICLDISGNTTVGHGTSAALKQPGIGLRKQGTVSTTHDFGIEGMAATASPGVENYVNGLNPGSAAGGAGSGGVGGTILISAQSGFSNCSSAPNAALVFGGAATAKSRPTMDAARSTSVITPGSSMDTDPRPAFGLINGKFVRIPEGQSAPSALPNTKAPAATPEPTNNAPAPAAAPRIWSDMPAMRVIRTPQSDEAKDEDEDEQKKAEEQNDASGDSAPAPESEQKPAKKAVRKNISYVGPLGAASDDTPRFVNASYSPAGDRRAEGARQMKATPRAAAAAARAPAPFAGETVNVNIGNMANADSVTIRFRVTVKTPFTTSPEQVSNQGSVSYNESGTPVLTDDPSVGGASDPTVTPVDASRFISIHDAQVVKPTSPDTIDMTFTVSLSAPAASAVTVNFQTNDGSATAGICNSGGDYTNTNGQVAFATGQQVMTINVPVCGDSAVGETFTVTLSSPSGASINDGTATGTITGNTSGTILISELRTSGPGGLGDDFIEVYNNSDSAHTVAATDGSAGYGVFKMGADCNATPVLVGVIPNTTVIPARGHFLLVGSQYSLGNYGGTGAAAGNLTLASDIESDRNVGIFSTSDVAAVSSVNRFDAAGFGANVGGACNLLREGAPLAAQSGSAKEHTFFRKMCDFLQGSGCTTPGFPKDTNANATDFQYADTAPDNSGTQRLGAPGPENMGSPRRKDHLPNGFDVVLLDGGRASSAVPNRERLMSPSDPANNSTFGTLMIRRRVINNTGAPVTRLRFRIVEMTPTVYPPPPGATDLRARSSSDSSIVNILDGGTCANEPGNPSPPCTVTVKGLTLETPPAQPAGGGINSTLTLTLGTPMPTNTSVNVEFKLGVMQTGTFRFLIIVEALP